MFVGRGEELATLEGLYAKGELKMVVVYGRRRVGKTRLLGEFAKGKRTLFFTAQQKSNVLNLREFSRALNEFVGMPSSTPAFASWMDAFGFLADWAGEHSEPFVFVFDEFPYAAEAEPSLPSALQIAIDHKFKALDMCLVLCGSNEGFMEGEVLGRKSPLFGRRNAQIRLGPLDYLDAARFLPGKGSEELAGYYAAFGGTPYYLEQIDPDCTFEENVEHLLFTMSGTLYAEPELLLKQETREPALYSSVLDAVGSGATIPKQIAERAGLVDGSVGRYLKSLEGLGIIERQVPFGENPERSRKGIYQIKDPFFAYWYRFVSPYVGAIESGLGAVAAKRALQPDAFSTYVGHVFESMCMQWVIRRARAGELPLLPLTLGKWWGTDPRMREQVDIDLVAADEVSGSILLGECKWRNKFDETEALRVLEGRGGLIRGYAKTVYVLFSKVPFSDGTREKEAGRDDLMLVTADDLYDLRGNAD